MVQRLHTVPSLLARPDEGAATPARPREGAPPATTSVRLATLLAPTPRATIALPALGDATPPMPRPLSPVVPARFCDPERARAIHGHRADLLAPALLRSDPLADAVVESFVRLRAGRGARMLEAVLDHGLDAAPDAPDSLVALCRQVEEVPLWVDWDELAVGGGALMRTGMLGLLTLMCHSLPMAYAVAAGNKPLTFSGKLVARATRRLNETGRFVIETCRPGGLRRFGEGFKITIKVRLMHAQIRRLLLLSGRWDTGRWALPINQADMAATNVTFSAVVLRGLRRLGVRLSARERSAVMQLWRYSGFLIGVEPGLLCATEEEALRLAGLMWMTRGAADEDSRQLVRALMGCRLAPPLDRVGNVAGLLEATTRAMVGDELADELGIPRTAAARLLPFIRAAVLGGELARVAVPGVDRWMRRAGERLWETIIASGLAGQPAGFRMPASLSATRPTTETAAVA